jgi:hypothetical protein
MKVCLAAPSSRKFLENEFHHCKYMLESFYSMPKWLIPIIKQCDFFMLDSGAFTFMNNFKGEVNFDEYLTKYIEFINEHDIKYFFELDVDSVTGIEKVEQLRRRLESETGKKSIPVWHKSRGKQYFIDMCKEYEYVAIGGIVTKEIKPKDYKYFRWFIDTAHSHGCKIHGLGFTNLQGMKIYNFDSVDSTSWTAGGKFGTLYWFDGRNMKMVDTGDRRRRTDINTDKINRHNYYEWVKFQQYADIHY